MDGRWEVERTDWCSKHGSWQINDTEPAWHCGHMTGQGTVPSADVRLGFTQILAQAASMTRALVPLIASIPYPQSPQGLSANQEGWPWGLVQWWPHTPLTWCSHVNTALCQPTTALRSSSLALPQQPRTLQ